MRKSIIKSTLKLCLNRVKLVVSKLCLNSVNATSGVPLFFKLLNNEQPGGFIQKCYGHD